MKNYQVRATRGFKDLVENVQREKGDIWNCTKERYEYLVSANNAVELIAEVKEETVKPLKEAPLEDALTEEQIKVYKEKAINTNEIKTNKSKNYNRKKK